MTGGQLVAAARERYGTFFSVTRSQVYRELPVLAKAGLLELGERGARASQQYVITRAGRRAFKSWLLAGEGADQLRSPLVLRLRHAGSLTSRQRRNLVAHGRAAYAERLALAEDAAKKAAGRSRPAPYDQAIAEFAVAHNRAVLALLDAIPTD
jgi:DNA-binding PadR family transcriptional regulator